MQKTKHTYNLKKERVATNHVHHFGVEQLPTSVDLRSNCPPVYDQGQLGSCTANSLSGCYQFLDKSYLPSRLFLYYNERALDGDISQDAGSTISQGIKALETIGVCDEQSWPYIEDKFTIKPSQNCYSEAKLHEVIKAIPVGQTLEAMKQCLASGFPIALGIEVYSELESQEVATTGMCPMPGPDSQLLGGHAIMCVGYSDETQMWTMRNSWGK
jgi:C1A family cysteine protease